MRITCALIAGGLILVGAVGRAQQTPAQSQPTFRTGTILVPLDIHVLDKNGKPVTGLTAKDFTVKEDDVAQHIAHFSIVNLVPQAPEPGAPLIRGTTQLDLASPQTRRVFLLALGEGRLQGPSKGVDAMIQFVRTQLLPQDQVAVAAWNRATDFTTDHDQILRVLGEFKRLNDKIQTRLDVFTSPLASVYRVPEEFGDIQKDIDSVFHPTTGEGPGVRTILAEDPADTNKGIKENLQALLDIWMRAAPEARLNALTGSSATTSLNPQQASQTLDIPLGMSFEAFAAVSHATMSDLGRLLAGVEYLRGVDGEKHLVFVSEHGLFLPAIPKNGKNDHDLVGMANDARVAIDTIQTGGVMTTSQQEFGMESAHREPTAEETDAIVALSRMAELTGGVSSSYSYADQAFSHLNEVTTSAYLLGYYPTNATLDGGYRHIAVTVNRPGLTVVFRHGIFATTNPKFNSAQALAYDRVVTGLKYWGAIHDVPFTLSVSRTTATPPERHLEVALSVAGLTFASADGQQNATLDVVVYCFNKDGIQMADSWKTVRLNVPDEDYGHLPADAVSKYNVHIPDATRSVKVVVYDYRSDRLGIVSLKVDPKK